MSREALEGISQCFHAIRPDLNDNQVPGRVDAPQTLAGLPRRIADAQPVNTPLPTQQFGPNTKPESR
jgi:hypothetical protein